MKYIDLLKDRRWQAKRLQILFRDKFTCLFCRNRLLNQPELFPNNNSVHVHHLRYINGILPWEYKNSLLVTLCEVCHGMCYGDNTISYMIIGKIDYYSCNDAIDLLRKPQITSESLSVYDEIDTSGINRNSDEASMTNETQLSTDEIRALRLAYRSESSPQIDAIMAVLDDFSYPKLKFSRCVWVGDTPVCSTDSMTIEELIETHAFDFIDRVATDVAQAKEKAERKQIAKKLFNNWSMCNKIID